MNRHQKILAKRESRVEDTATDLINVGERFANTGHSLWDLKNLRQSLLEAGRSYGKAVAALSRKI